MFKGAELDGTYDGVETNYEAIALDGVHVF